jgi:hypothetical protein
VDGQVVVENGIARLVDEQELRNLANQTIRKLWHGRS